MAAPCDCAIQKESTLHQVAASPVVACRSSSRLLLARLSLWMMSGQAALPTSAAQAALWCHSRADAENRPLESRARSKQGQGVPTTSWPDGGSALEGFDWREPSKPHCDHLLRGTIAPGLPNQPPRGDDVAAAPCECNARAVASSHPLRMHNRVSAQQPRSMHTYCMLCGALPPPLCSACPHSICTQLYGAVECGKRVAVHQ
jgi:hypothetical protein